MGSYWPVHAHSEFSTLDGMGTVHDMVQTVIEYDQPALALTDHGNMAGAIQLYRECSKAGIKAFPGSELYVVRSFDNGKLPDGTAYDDRKRRYHMGVLALDYEGWKALVKLSSMTHQRDHFHQKPLVSLAELLEWGDTYGDHVAVTTGCYFGWVIQHMIEWEFDLDRVATMVRLIADSFPHLFVELQNHNIEHDFDMTDTTIVRALLEVAGKLGLPVVAGQDSHMCDLYEQPVHDMMKKIAYLGGNGEDSKFPGDGFHLADDEWMIEHHRPWWDGIVEGHDHLYDLGDLRVPALDTYQFRVPEVGGNEDERLRAMVDEAFAKSDQWGDKVYAKQIEKELGVIADKGFAGYFLIVADYCRWARDHGIVINARGSANGSLVCFYAGITEVDPIEWGLDFDRFLSHDREKPPDVDLDVESDRRDDVIGYLRSRFPSLVQIGTWNRLGIADDEEQKGSVFVQWHAAARSRGQDGEIPQADVELLRQLSLTSVRKSVGAHAGGFVLPGAGHPIDELLATMLIASSNTTVTQAPMDDVEAAGYVKVDMLGLRSLTTVRKTLELIGKDPVVDGLRWIPNNDRAACRLLSSGQMDNGIFQFEGYATAKGAKQVRVRNMDDAILTLALYRPALMHGGQTERYLKARRSGVREIIDPTVDDLFDGTLGVPVWQEDVLNLMKRVGLGVEDRNAILKAVKMSNDRIAIAEKTFKRVHPIFVQSAMDTLKVGPQAAERMWGTVMEFTDYGFAKSHATAYGVMSYRMAYLKAHYPLEFMAALLETWAGTDKEPKYISEARRMRLTIHRPDVNRSKAGWSIEGENGVRRGFRSINGIGEAGAVALAELAPYESIEDLCERVPGRAVPGSKKYLAKKTRGEFGGALEALRQAGALKSLGIEKVE